MWTAKFWKASVERSIKTFAQTMIAAIGGGQLDIVNIDLAGAASLGLGAALLSVLTSLASAKLTNGTDPSLV